MKGHKVKVFGQIKSSQVKLEEVTLCSVTSLHSGLFNGVGDEAAHFPRTIMNLKKKKSAFFYYLPHSVITTRTLFLVGGVKRVGSRIIFLKYLLGRAFSFKFFFNLISRSSRPSRFLSIPTAVFLYRSLPLSLTRRCRGTNTRLPALTQVTPPSRLPSPPSPPCHTRCSFVVTPVCHSHTS